MSKTYQQTNWCPKSFQEFSSAAKIGRVELQILPDQYTWLYENILPYRFQLWSLFSSVSYKEKLLRKMIVDEATFRAVHDKGIDLMLLTEAR